MSGNIERSVTAQLEAATLPQHRAIFIQQTPELALRQARAAARRQRAGERLGPLDGVTVSWKDLFGIKGLPTTCGSRVTACEPASRDAACVHRLHAAGAVCLGKTNLSEFAFSGLGLNPHFGTPTQTAPGTGDEHVVGGSSSGAAAAVRAGLGRVAMSTDTSGSVRVPAAWSGLVGYRPTQDRYSGEGVARLAPSLDTVGVIARSMADVLAVDAALARGSGAVEASPPRFVLVENFCGPEVQPELREAVERFAARLRQDGFACERRRIAVLDAVREAFERHGTLVAAEAALELGRHAHDLRLDPFVRWRLLQACALPASARGTLLRLRSQWIGLVPRGEILLFPTTPCSAPPIAALDTLEAIAHANALALRHTMPCSFLDMPGITLPCGRDALGLPVGVLLTGARGSDARLLAVAADLEARRIGTE